MTQAAAGWYPQSDGTQRYWDGSAWTEHTAPGAAPPTPPAPPVEAAPPPPPAPPAMAAAPAPQVSGYAALPPQGSAGYASSTPRRRVWPWLVGIGGALVVLGVLVVIVVVVFVGKVVVGPKSAAADFNDAYFSGDCEAYLAITTADFRDSDSYPGTCEEAAVSYFDEAAGAGISISLDGVEVNGSTATVTGTLKSPDLGEGSLTYHLVKVDGKWLVDAID